jgi:hypothetical protein
MAPLYNAPGGVGSGDTLLVGPLAMRSQLADAMAAIRNHCFSCTRQTEFRVYLVA